MGEASTLETIELIMEQYAYMARIESAAEYDISPCVCSSKFWFIICSDDFANCMLKVE